MRVRSVSVQRILDRKRLCQQRIAAGSVCPHDCLKDSLLGLAPAENRRAGAIAEQTADRAIGEINQTAERLRTDHQRSFCLSGAEITVHNICGIDKTGACRGGIKRKGIVRSDRRLNTAGKRRRITIRRRRTGDN